MSLSDDAKGERVESTYQATRSSSQLLIPRSGGYVLGAMKTLGAESRFIEKVRPLLVRAGGVVEGDGFGAFVGRAIGGPPVDEMAARCSCAALARSNAAILEIPKDMINEGRSDIYQYYSEVARVMSEEVTRHPYVAAQFATALIQNRRFRELSLRYGTGERAEMLRTRLVSRTFRLTQINEAARLIGASPAYDISPWVGPIADLVRMPSTQA